MDKIREDANKEKSLMDRIDSLKKLGTERVASLRSKFEDQLSKLKKLKDKEILEPREYQYRVRDLDQAYKLKKGKIEAAIKSQLNSIKRDIVHGAGYDSKIPDVQATRFVSRTTPIGNPKRYMFNRGKDVVGDVGKTAEEVASKVKGGGLKKAAIATASVGAITGGALLAKKLMAKKNKKSVKESEMFKEYLSTVVEEVVKTNKLTPLECIKTVREIESMSESDCKSFLFENMKYAIQTEAKSFKKKVSDHVAPKPENDSHIKKDARSTAKYVKQKKDVSKMLSGIKKKFREQVAFSIVQSVKESRDDNR